MKHTEGGKHPSKKQQEVDMDKIHDWMRINQAMLTEWLSKVVTISSSERVKSPAIFQEFRIPIHQPGIQGILNAQAEMQYIVLLAVVLGKGQKGIAKAMGVGWEAPPRIDGFTIKFDRFPIATDSILFTADKWNLITYENLAPNQIVTVSGMPAKAIPMLVTNCAVDFLVSPTTPKGQ